MSASTGIRRGPVGGGGWGGRAALRAGLKKNLFRMTGLGLDGGELVQKHVHCTSYLELTTMFGKSVELKTKSNLTTYRFETFDNWYYM